MDPLIVSKINRLLLNMNPHLYLNKITDAKTEGAKNITFTLTLILGFIEWLLMNRTCEMT